MTGMDTGVAFEIRVFFLCGLCGVACSVVYDLFRIARRCLKTGAAATFVLDLLFWLSSAYLTFSMVFYANYGRVRWYEFFGLLLGGFVYFMSISRWVTDGGVRTVNFFAALINKLLHLLLFPLFFVLKILFRPIFRIHKNFLKKMRKNRLTMGHFWFKIRKRMEFYTKFLRK